MTNGVQTRYHRSIRLNRDGFTAAQQAMVYGVRPEKIQRIRFGRNNNRLNNAKLTFETAEKMRRMKAAGVPQWKIAKRFGVSDATVSLVVRNLIWCVK